MATIYITDTKTGETREYEDEWNGVFIWSKGNYSCDCNRALFFARAGGEPDPDIECGYDIFKIKIEHNGVVLYDENNSTT